MISQGDNETEFEKRLRAELLESSRMISIENCEGPLGGPLLGFEHVRNWHEGEAEGGAKPVRLCPCRSDVDLFSYGEGIIDFNAEIPDGALDLRVS
jgi:hypothetical protein